MHRVYFNYYYYFKTEAMVPFIQGVKKFQNEKNLLVFKKKKKKEGIHLCSKTRAGFSNFYKILSILAYKKAAEMWYFSVMLVCFN